MEEDIKRNEDKNRGKECIIKQEEEEEGYKEVYIKQEKEEIYINRKEENELKTKNETKIQIFDDKIEFELFAEEINSRFILNQNRNLKNTPQNEEQIYCLVCDNVSTNVIDSVRHRYVHSDFSCRFCPKKFKSAPALKSHVWKHANIASEDDKKDEKMTFFIQRLRTIYVCHLCRQTYKSLSLLQNHIISCHKLKKPVENLENWTFGPECDRYECRFCSRTFRTYSEYCGHFDSHKRESRCEICSQTFPGPDVLKVHLELGHKDCFGCPKCDKKYSTLQVLKTHLLTHDNILMYKCKICSKRFVSGAYLVSILI